MEAILKKYEIFIIPAVSLLIGSLIFALVVVRETVKIPKTAEEIEAAQSKYQLLKDKADLLDREVNVEEYQDGIVTAIQALPLDREMPGAFGQMLFLLRSNGLILDDISFSIPNSSQAAKLDEYTVKVSFSGPSTGLISMIDKLKESPRVMKVSSIEVNNSKTSADVQAVIDMTTFFQGLPANLGNVDQQVAVLTKDDKKLLESINEYIKKVPPDADENTTGVTGKPDPFQ